MICKRFLVIKYRTVGGITDIINAIGALTITKPLDLNNLLIGALF